MLKPIIEKETISLSNTITFLLFKVKKLSRMVFIVMIFFMLFFFLKTPTYTSKVSFYTNYQEDIQSSLLSIVPSFMSGGLSANTIDFSVNNYVSSDKFLIDIVNRVYMINGKNVTLVDQWGQDYNDFLIINPISLASRINRYFLYSNHLTVEEIKEAHAATVLLNSLSYSEDRRTKLHLISLEIEKDPALAAQIMNNIYESIVSYSNEIVNKKASEKRAFIDNRLEEVKKDLQDFEEELLNFMEQNKDIDFSPSLTLQKQRLQKNVTLYDQLYFTLSDQLELAKINEKDKTSSFFLLDMPDVYPIKSGLSLIKGGLFIAILSFIVGYIYYGFKYRKELFHF
tara:strand:+ start:996 stop:2018 length:1023 start_codon:yes stop_codon:yes gene_type:complete